MNPQRPWLVGRLDYEFPQRTLSYTTILLSEHLFLLTTHLTTLTSVNNVANTFNKVGNHISSSLSIRLSVRLYVLPPTELNPSLLGALVGNTSTLNRVQMPNIGPVSWHGPTEWLTSWEKTLFFSAAVYASTSSPPPRSELFNYSRTDGGARNRNGRNKTDGGARNQNGKLKLKPVTKKNQLKLTGDSRNKNVRNQNWRRSP